MTAKSSAHSAWKRVRTMVCRFWGTIGGKSAGVPFAEGSRTFYSTTQCWVHTSGAVVVTGISVLQGWQSHWISTPGRWVI